MTTLNTSWQQIAQSSGFSWAYGTEYIQLYAWAEENISGNYSTVHTLLRVSVTNGSIDVSSWSAGLDGSPGTSGGYTTFSGSTNIIEGSYDVAHNADGTGSVIVHASWNATYGETSWSVGIPCTLQTIPRASQPSLNTGSIECNGGNAFTIYTNRASSSFAHTITYTFGNNSGTIATNVGDKVSWTPSTSLLNQIPNSTSGIGTIYCTTYSGGTKIGDTKSVNFSLTCNYATPILSNQSVTELNSLVGTSADYTVIGVSNKLIKVSASSQQYSSISSVKVTVANVDYGMSLSNEIYSYTLNKSQSGTYKITAIDSRGLSSSVTITQTEHRYYVPYATSTSFTRPTVLSNTGDLVIKGNWFNELSNVLSVSVTVVNTESGSTSFSVDSTLTVSNNTFTITVTEATFTDKLDYRYAFKATAVVTDALGASVNLEAFLSSAQWVWLEADDSFWIQGTLYINGKTLLDRTWPVGSIYFQVGTTASPASVLGGTWAALVGDWRMILAGPPSFGNGSTGGSLTTGSTAITIAQMPSHTHRQLLGGYLSNVQNVPGSYIVSNQNDGDVSYTGGNQGHTHSMNWEPYITVTAWKRTA